MLRKAARFRIVVAVVVSLVGLGCRRPTLEIDEKRLVAEVDRRATAAIDKPDVKLAFDAFATSLLDDPALSSAGERLATALGADPTLSPGFEAVLGEFGKQPAMQALVAKLKRENPRASPEKIGELAGEHVSTVTQSPLFGRAFERAFEYVLKQPDVAAAFNRFGDAVATDGILMAKLSRLFETPATEERWRKRLTELNGGKFPDKERATTLLLDHAVSSERLSRFYRDLLALPVLKREFAAALRDVVVTPSFQRHVVEAVRQCVDDESFRRNAVASLTVLLVESPTEDQLYQGFRRLLETPVVSRSLTGLLERTLADKELGAIGKRALSTVVADAALQALFVQLFEHF